MASTILSIISDTHVGSSTAVSPPKFTIHTSHPEEEHVVEYNRIQRELYEYWKDYWDYVKQLAGIRGKYRKNRLIIFHLGDAVDGNHHNSVQLIPEIEDQVNAAFDLLKIPVGLADKMYLTYGTDVHNGGNGEYEVSLAGELGNTVEHSQFFSLSIDDTPFDLAHHGRASKRDWTSSAANYAVEVALDYVKNGMKPPRYVLRGHNHIIDDSGQKVQYTRAISCPSWQLRTSFGHRVKSGKAHCDIGGLIWNSSQPDYMEFSRARYCPPKEDLVYEVV